jgi:membrane-associated HD superfamily phosphohydrolase
MYNCFARLTTRYLQSYIMILLSPNIIMFIITFILIYVILFIIIVINYHIHYYIQILSHSLLYYLTLSYYDIILISLDSLMEKFRALVPEAAAVIRDGITKPLAATEIVIGDIIRLKSGQCYR